MARLDTLYVCDLDGTLLNTESRVSDTSASIISELGASGMLITVATARTPATVVPLLAHTDTRPDAIVMTGAATWNRRRCQFDNVRALTPELVKHTLEICHGHNIEPFVYVVDHDMRTLDAYHGGCALNNAEQSYWLERRNMPLKRFHLGRSVPRNDTGRVLLLYAMGQAADIVPVAEELRARTQLTVCCYPDIFNPSLANLEILAPGVSKAAAIRKIAADTGARRTVVFGDNLNDLPMFAIADMAVAVDNAQPEVKDAADIVIGPNYTDAVARFIHDDA